MGEIVDADQQTVLAVTTKQRTGRSHRHEVVADPICCPVFQLPQLLDADPKEEPQPIANADHGPVMAVETVGHLTARVASGQQDGDVYEGGIVGQDVPPLELAGSWPKMNRTTNGTQQAVPAASGWGASGGELCRNFHG